MILNVQSEFPALSEYIIDELIANTVNDRVFPVVDQQQLNTIRAELDFQMSGEVDDETAQSLGRMAGAQVIISGAVSRIGDLYRLRVRALSVQDARITGQFNRNIPGGSTVSALVRSQATGYGGSSNYGGSGGPAVSGTSGGNAGSSSMVAQTPAAPVPTVVYKIGDTGPAGGIVFYDKFSNEGGWRYLECAPVETEQQFPWGPEGRNIRTQTGPGTGKMNTESIVDFFTDIGAYGCAAQYCAALEYGGYDDWFLPSRDELNLLYTNLYKKGLGGFSRGWYWSSSDNMDDFLGRWAWGQDFRDGRQSSESRVVDSDGVRSIRAV
jgi:hypothetical protein